MIRYRPDIDGLRAVAVCAVVLFHLSHAILPGGYLGVDMFFVVSGFLITSIIWQEAMTADFSVARFYDRRIRRIMPALLLLLVITTSVGTILLLPTDLIGYGKSLGAALGFVANIYFWRDVNYFARVADEKPLLHLWSLGVEEQFYVLFPIIVALVARRWPRIALPLVALLTAVSLALNSFALFIDGSLPAFFLLPTRLWELGFGAMLALLPPQLRLSMLASNMAAAAGALLILVPIVHPSAQFLLVPEALPVVGGTALIILAGLGAEGPISRALKFRPLVFVGLISYSLYLWHWPIIVFEKYYLVRELTNSEIVMALACMLACATVSWRYAERLFRRTSTTINTVRAVALAGTLALVAAAVLLVLSNGLPGRLDPEAATINAAVATNYRCPVRDYVKMGLSRACVMNLPSRDPADADAVLIGNSHAQMYAPVWTAIFAEQGLHGLLIPVNGCLPTPMANINRGCADTAKRNLVELLALPRVRVVVLGLTWLHGPVGLVGPSGQRLDNRNDRALVTALDDLIDKLRGAGKKVVLIGPIAEPGWDVASVLSRDLAFHHPVDHRTYTPASDFERRFGSVLQHFDARSDMGFARPDRVQCHDDRCEYLLSGHSLFADDNHIAAAELPRFHALFQLALRGK